MMTMKKKMIRKNKLKRKKKLLTKSQSTHTFRPNLKRATRLSKLKLSMTVRKKEEKAVAMMPSSWIAMGMSGSSRSRNSPLKIRPTNNRSTVQLSRNLRINLKRSPRRQSSSRAKRWHLLHNKSQLLGSRQPQRRLAILAANGSLSSRSS